SLEMLPEFSSRRGLWDVTAQLTAERIGPVHGRLDAQSRLHAGDGLIALFRLRDKGKLLVKVDAVEGKGGALAGAAGLPTDSPFYLSAQVNGGPDGGRLSITSKSGSAVPASASGSWNKDGATLNAVAILAASHLTQGYAAKVGPEVRIALTTRHAKGDVFDIDGSMLGKDAQVYARGPIDWRRRLTPGLQLKLAVSELKRWVSLPAIGPTRASGVFTGDLDRFTYKGGVEADQLTQSGYVLDHISGPATLTRKPGEWRMQAALEGRGGHGQGLFAAILGAKPTVAFDGARIADGRMVFRSLKAVGPGLKLDAEGGQDLLGGMSFKGNALISNLAAARPGAGGTVTASWTAGAGKGLPEWKFNFDAKGDGLATGVTEVDRLMGPAPRLVAEATWGPTGLGVASAELTGAKGRAGAKGTLSPNQVMGFDLDWRAEGPFAVGPVELAGEMAGSGRLTGKFDAPAVDLMADLASIDVGKLVVKPAHLTLMFAKSATGADGQVAVTGSSPWGAASARSAFRFVEGGVDLKDILADAGGVKASGALALRNGAPSSADLTLAVGPGAFLKAGQLKGAVKLTERSGGAVAAIALDGKNLAVPEVAGSLETVTLRADGPWAKLPYTLGLQTAAPLVGRFNGGGVLTQTDAAQELSLSGSGRVRRADFRTLEPAVLKMGKAGRSLRMKLSIAEGRADIDAEETADTARIKATLAALPMAAFNQDFVGMLTGDLDLSGRGKTLAGALTVALDKARSRDAPESLALAGQVKARLDGGVIHVDAGATNSQGLKSNVSLDLPADASAAPFQLALSRDRQLKGSFSVDGELRPLWELFAGADRTLGGRLTASGSVWGTLAKPESGGVATLANGRLEDVGTGLNLQDLAIRAEFGNNAVLVRQFAGGDGHGGTVSGEGKVSLLPDGDSTFTVDLKRFQLLGNKLAKATVSGPVTVTRDSKGQAKLSGTLGVDRADITAKPPVPNGVVAMDVVEINRPRTEGDETPKLGGPTVNLDVAIRAARGVYVKGAGLSVELSLDAHVGGTVIRPDLSGQARVVLGEYDFAGKRFDFDERSLVRLGSTPETIRLDLIATREDPSLTAIVRVQGTAAKPLVTLSSMPVLPQDEVLAQVLFGHSASQLSSFEAAQLASALTSLATGGGFDVVGGLRQFARLDRLAFGGGASGMAVSGGKYLTNDIYLELTGGGREGPSAQVEWRVRRNLSVISTVAKQGDARLSLRFRKNY
ncbi:MAG: translocation/assembly module TamB domain-containing protein, partial [Caulobacteraceae bacterium]